MKRFSFKEMVVVARYAAKRPSALVEKQMILRRYVALSGGCQLKELLSKLNSIAETHHELGIYPHASLRECIAHIVYVQKHLMDFARHGNILPTKEETAHIKRMNELQGDVVQRSSDFSKSPKKKKKKKKKKSKGSASSSPSQNGGSPNLN
ncbi:MAG: hypothetical protein AB7T49_00320 [Oligoflexales bacterium]